jgi:hypothetical protein
MLEAPVLMVGIEAVGVERDLVAGRLACRILGGGGPVGPCPLAGGASVIARSRRGWGGMDGAGMVAGFRPARGGRTRSTPSWVRLWSRGRWWRWRLGRGCCGSGRRRCGRWWPGWGAECCCATPAAPFRGWVDGSILSLGRAVVEDRARDVGLIRCSLIREPSDPGLSKAERGALAAVGHRGPGGRAVMVVVGRSTLDDWARPENTEALLPCQRPSRRENGLQRTVRPESSRTRAGCAVGPHPFVDVLVDEVSVYRARA